MQAMQRSNLDPFGPSAHSAIAPVRFTDRFDPDREKLAALFARLGRKQAERRIIEDLHCISELAVLVQSRHEQGRYMEIESTLEVLRDLSEQIGLVPIIAAADALAGALQSNNPHAIGATLARLQRVTDRATVGIWPYCS